MKTMKFLLLILLLGVCLPDWTTAERRRHRRRREDSVIEDGTVMQIVMTNSTHIDLSHRKIDEFGDYAFSGIEKEDVKSIDLSHDNFDKFTISHFSFFSNIEKIFLSHNKIASLGRSYTELENLKYVDISSNPITKSLILEKNLVSGLPSSAILYIGADKIFPSEPVSVPLDYGQSRAEDWEYPENTRPQLTKYSQAKLCKTVDGLVKSVEELKENVTLGDCMKINVISVGSFMKTLDMSNLGLRKFEPDWYKFESDDITTLKLSNNTITDITPELLNDLPSKLTNIDLRWNNIKEIRNHTIHNRNIKFMRLDNNVISTIEDGAFENTNLTGLFLQKNRLDDLAFVKTLPASLKYLLLSYNLFSIVSANTFQGLKEMEGLYLSGCHIKTIETGAFDNLGRLHMLHMASNQISEIKSGLFKDVKNLREFDISFNQIRKIPRDIFSGIRDREMSDLRLDHNQIDTIEVGSFANWTIDNINLEMNKITEESVTKGVFEGSSIGTLNLGANLISEINESFLDSPALDDLNLTKNHIRSVKKGVIKNMQRLRELDLSENPLNHLENGAFHRLQSEMAPESIKINLSRVPIEYIEAGVFKDVSN